MDENKVRQIAQQVATQVYQQLGSRFGVNQTPTHTHNGIDSPTLPQFNQVNSGPGGVLSAENTAGQLVNVSPTSPNNYSNIFSVPIPIIYGNGVGAASQFNGGEAVDGTLIIFMNDPVAIQLWWRATGTVPGASRWYGVDVTAGGLNPALALGPLA